MEIHFYNDLYYYKNQTEWVCVGYYYVESGEYDTKTNTISTFGEFGNKYCIFTKLKMIGSIRFAFKFDKNEWINLREVDFSEYDSNYSVSTRNDNITKISIKKEYSKETVYEDVCKLIELSEVFEQ